MQITIQQTGLVTGLMLIRGSSSGGNAQIALYSDNNNTPAQRLTPGQEDPPPTLSTIPGLPLQIDTTEVLFSTNIELTAGQKIWACVKFSGSNIRHLRQFPDAEGLRFTATSPWGEAFLPDLTGVGSVNVTSGLYGIYLIMEDCEDPPVPVEGCTDENAFNFDPDATIDDGSCIFPILGCTDEDAFNFNPDAELDDGSCVLEVDCASVPDCFRVDVNIDGTINVFDVLIFLSAFGADTQSLINASWCNGIQLDMNNTGVLDAGDLSIMLTCFGLTLDWEAYYQSLGE